MLYSNAKALHKSTATCGVCAYVGGNVRQTYELTYMIEHMNACSHLWKFAMWRFECRGLTVLQSGKLLSREAEANACEEAVCVCVCESLSHVRLFATPWTIACQVRLSMAFSWQEYWSGLPFPSPVRTQRCGKSQPPFPQRSAKMQVYCRETRLYQRIGPTFWRDVLKNLDIMRKKSKVIHNWPCRNFFSLPWKTLTRVPTIFFKCISHHIIIVKTINSHF